MPTSKTAKKKNPHRGSTFDSFLAEEGILEDVEAIAVKRAIALKITDLMQQKKESVPLLFLTLKKVCNRNRKRFGARPTNIKCPAFVL